MLPSTAHEDFRTSFWPRVREFAVPASMIETATARRLAGDWAGACAAAGFDVDLDLRAEARGHGPELASAIRADLRALAPDLLRWHMPRVAPDGLLRPGLTLTLARYEADGDTMHLVARTPPAWADAGQRISLALWSRSASDAERHPHPRPNRRFRLDLHRHLWDAGRSGELRERAGAGPPGAQPPWEGAGLLTSLPYGCALDRWTAEARLLLGDEGRAAGRVLVRCGGRRRLLLELAADDDSVRTTTPAGTTATLPVLPDAATWVLPDLELLRTGTIGPDRLHPLVAAALAPGHVAGGPPRTSERTGQPRLVECRGARHRIGLVDGVLVPLDHDAAEIRREELLVALTGTPLPCLRAIDEAHRRPHCLEGVRERLVHGDTAGALAVVEELLGPEALLRTGPLRDELEAAALRRVTYGLFRAGLTGPGPAWFRPRLNGRHSHDHRTHPRHATAR
ncbi:hypothetical protein OHT57_06845 [Streptomyces sp. NBC_00285]|uniref:hypothetical protein n=1 Tax=Streptomyces sp. NBC_00285 TaxID=2975700 RepID=UPI002E29FF63|nr:hypothetical protein [Streptomyces sp. NBC_00285]